MYLNISWPVNPKNPGRPNKYVYSKMATFSGRITSTFFKWILLVHFVLDIIILSTALLDIFTQQSCSLDKSELLEYRDPSQGLRLISN